METFVQPSCASLTRRCVRLLLQFSIAVASVCWFCALVSGAQPANQSRRVVVVVWDGMRPDFVSEQNTPALWKLSREGVIFRNHHAVYPSATMVNGTALVTGVYPGKNGIIANHVYRPDIDPRHAIDVEVASVVEKGDELSGGKYVAAPTIAELVQRAGARSVVAAAKTVGLLLDRQIRGRRDIGGSSTQDSISLPDVRRQGDAAIQNSVTLFAGQSLPSAALAPITEALGPGPSAHLQNDFWTTKALINVLWKNGLPPFSILWLGEPDLTQHETAPGAPAALVATVTRRLVELLQHSDFAGVIFTRQPMEGTFELEQARIQNDRAPDVVMAFRSYDSKNQFGIPGMIDADWQRAAGKGTHATLSRFDMHNTLVAAGPDFKPGETDDLASGNVDLAPT